MNPVILADEIMKMIERDNAISKDELVKLIKNFDKPESRRLRVYEDIIAYELHKHFGDRLTSVAVYPAKGNNLALCEVRVEGYFAQVYMNQRDSMRDVVNIIIDMLDE